jgi:type I restriction enzyme R subunit
MGIALSSRVFYEEYGEKQIDDYKKELKFFQSLRRAVKNRYAEMLDRAEYEPKIKRILDTYVTSGDMVQITGQVDIFDRVKFDKAVEKAEGKAAMADTIAYNTRRTIHDKFDEDPVFFKKFSDLLEEAIAAFRAERMSDAQYLEKIKDIAANIINKDNKDLPRELKNNDTAAAVYRVIKHELESTGREGFEPTTAALAIDDIIIKNAIVDWQYNEDAKTQ